MAIVIYKSIAGYRRRRAEAAAPGEQDLSPDGPPPTQQAPRPDGQAAKMVKAGGREPAARGLEGTGQVSRPAVIEVRGLRKSYDGLEAVAGIDLEVRAGEIFAFLGPNGAGKTTTVEILEGYRRRDAGDVSVLGVDPARAGRDWRARIGVVLQESEPESELTAEECLSLYAGYYPASRPVAETLDLVGLADHRTARCGQMSGGQRRRLDVALALIGDPELIFLDEPTTGFDPAARKSAWGVIAGLRDLGKTIFLTTHYMEEAEYLADRIAVLAAGQIVAEGTAATVGGRDTEASIVSFTLPPGLPAADLPTAVAGCVTRTANGHVEADTRSPLRLVGVLAGWAAARGIDLPDLDVHRPTLEDVYLQLTRES
jgi:ABC-2 type transport system ATP-binding protein